MLKRAMLLLAIAFTFTACAETRHYMNGNNTVAGARKVTDNSDYFLYGVGQGNEIDATAICGRARDVVAVETKETFLNAILRGLTFGIYSPQEQSVYCRQR